MTRWVAPALVAAVGSKCYVSPAGVDSRYRFGREPCRRGLRASRRDVVLMEPC